MSNCGFDYVVYKGGGTLEMLHILKTVYFHGKILHENSRNEHLPYFHCSLR